VDPFDRFNNTLPAASGYAVTINGGDPIPLLASSFSYKYAVPRSYSGNLQLSFTLNGAEIANSPVVVAVFPDWTIVYVGVASGVLLVLGLAAFVWYRRISKVQLGRMRSNLLGVELSQNRIKEEKARLEADMEELEEEVRLKKHSEEALKVMVAALEAVSKERQDELKEVMMESKELKIDKLLGKGGFGVVNLATYRGTKVAMKQVSPPPPLPRERSELQEELAAATHQRPPPSFCASGAGGSSGRAPEQPPSLALDSLSLAPDQHPSPALASLARVRFARSLACALLALALAPDQHLSLAIAFARSRALASLARRTNDLILLCSLRLLPAPPPPPPPPPTLPTTFACRSCSP
jgi:hypothetical protein